MYKTMLNALSPKLLTQRSSIELATPKRLKAPLAKLLERNIFLT